MWRDNNRQSFCIAWYWFQPFCVTWECLAILFYIYLYFIYIFYIYLYFIWEWPANNFLRTVAKTKAFKIIGKHMWDMNFSEKFILRHGTVKYDKMINILCIMTWEWLDNNYVCHENDWSFNQYITRTFVKLIHYELRLSIFLYETQMHSYTHIYIYMCACVWDV